MVSSLPPSPPPAAASGPSSPWSNTAAGLVETTPLPAFARLCFNFRSLLLALPLLAVAYCVFVWVRKSDGHKSWVAFFATTMYTLVLLSFPVALTGWIMLVQFIELLAKR